MTTRRAVLLGAAAVTAGTGLSLAGAAGASAARTGARVPAGSGRAIPQTLANRVSPADRAGTTVRTGRTSFPLSHLALTWRGPGQPKVRLRSVSGWGGWQAVHTCQGGPDGAARTARAAGTAVGRQGALLTVPGAVGYEIGLGGGAGGLSVTELNTVDGPARTRVDATPGQLRIDGLTASAQYFTRAAWGADESLRFAADGTETWPPEYFPVQTLTVHHTAGANSDPDPAATVRAIYFFHAVTQDFGDIGYHLLIDEAGNLYEGRWSGADFIPVFGTTPGPDNRLQMVNAGHTLGFNAGNIGVALLGDFTSQLPAAAARATLTSTLATLAGVSELDPLGTTAYLNPISGAAKTVNTISGHRDWLATECPGNTFYPQLPSLRQDVAAQLGGQPLG